MSEEYTEHDLETPTEQDLDAAYGSKFLSSSDIGDRKIKTKIAKVRQEEMRADNGKTRKKFVLFLDGIDKPMVLNATRQAHVRSAAARVAASCGGGSDAGTEADDQTAGCGCQRVAGRKRRSGRGS